MSVIDHTFTGFEKSSGMAAKVLDMIRPRVDPSKLNAFTRAFTTTRGPTSKFFGSPEADRIASESALDRINGPTPIGRLADKATDVLNDYETRVSPTRVGAAIAGTAGTTAALAKAISGASTGIPYAAGVVPALFAALAGGYAYSKMKKGVKSSKKDRGQGKDGPNSKSRARPGTRGKMRKKADDSSYVPGSLLGGLAGLAAADSEAAKRFAVRILTRKGSPYRIYSDTRIAPDFNNGSGEAKMTGAVVKLLHKNGIGVTYAPEFTRYQSEYANSGYIGADLSGTGKQQLESIMKSPAWTGADIVSADGKRIKQTGLASILSKDRSKYDRFVKNVMDGKYTGMTPGILRDFAKVDPDLLMNPDLIGREHLFNELVSAGKAKIGFNAFRGFTSPLWSPSLLFSHSKNLYDTHFPGGAINLGTASGFMANYSTGPIRSKWFIPGASVYRNPLNSSPEFAAKAHAIDREELVKLISDIRSNRMSGNTFKFGPNDAILPESLKDKTLIFMDSGSAGPNNESKFRNVLDALKDKATGKIDDKYHILFQTGRYGEGSFAPHLESLVAEAARNHPGQITPVKFLPGSALMNRLANGADLHITYGGSSTAGEAGSHLTPTVFTRDGLLNDKNISWVTSVRNGLGGNKMEIMDTVTSGYANALKEWLIDNNRGIVPSEAEDWSLEKVRNYVSGHGGKIPSRSDLETFSDLLAGDPSGKIGGRLGSGGRAGADRMLRILENPSLVDTAAEENRKVLARLLSSEVQGNRNSVANIDSVKKFISKADESNRHFVESARNAVVNALDFDDRSLMSGVKSSLGELFGRGSGLGRRLGAARRLASPKALKALGLSAGSLLSNSPIGRRAGIPLAAAGAIAGGLGLKALTSKEDSTLSKIRKSIGL